jgi:hypothetical protein
MSLDARSDQLLLYIQKDTRKKTHPAVSAAAEPEESNGEHRLANSIKCLVPVVDP